MPAAPLFAALALLGAAAEDAPATRPPNVLFIMCDDLGVGELGCYGQEIIRTPVLDRLAAEGHAVHAALFRLPRLRPGPVQSHDGDARGAQRYPRERVSRAAGRKIPEQSVWPGQNPIPAGAVTLAEMFQDAGYATVRGGQVGAGVRGQFTGDPTAQGFDRFFGYVCQWHAHNHYPRFLWDLSEEPAPTPTPPPG